MSKRAITTSASIIEGCIEKVRVAAPPGRGNIYLLVDGTPVLGTIEDADQIWTIRKLQDQHVPVRIGVLTDAGQMHRFSWLIAPSKQGVPPQFYRDERRKSWWFILIGLAIAAVAATVAVLLGTSAFWRALGMAISIAVSFAGLVLAGVATYGLWRMRLRRAAILRSESLYREDDGRPAKAAARRELPVASPSMEVASPGGDAQPKILRITGMLASLTHELRQPSNSQTTYGIYRFAIGKQAYVMTVSEDLGKVLPFLAEGDQVELAAYGGENPAGAEHRLVYAMRNLEDGRVYVCHRIFRGGDPKIAPVGVGMTQRAPLLRLVAGFTLVTWLMLLGIFHFSGSAREHDDLPMLALYAGVGLLAFWFCCALPFVYLDRRWRSGNPTRRQRTLERIYLALGLGSPFAPTAPIEEV